MNKNKLKDDGLVFLTLFFIFYLLVQSAINAPFTVEDEYNNYIWANPNLIFGSQSSFFQTLLSTIEKFMLQGRLLITHLFVIVGRAKLFGINPAGHHWVVFLFGLSSAFLLYKIFQISSISKINSFLGALIYITGYAYSEIFFRLSAGECTGNLFLLISIYHIVSYTKNNNIYNFYKSVFFGFFAALSKESYLILFPMIFAIPFLFKELHQWKAYVIDNMKGIYIISISLVILILSLFYTIKSSGIVFSYGEPLSKFDTIINNIVWIFKWFVLFAPIVLIALFNFIRKNNYQKLIPLFVFSAGWIISQLVAYNKVIISFSQGRYMMPSGLILILFIVLSLEQIKYNKRVYFVVCIMVGILIVRNGKIVYINANEFKARAVAFNNLIDKLVAIKPEKIAIYGGFEFYNSINLHFTYHNYHPKLITTPVVLRKDIISDYNDSDFRNELQNSLNKLYEFKTLDDLKSDTTIKYMITAEPEEYSPINYDDMMKRFKSVEKVAVNFSNPGFSDLFRKQFWIGELQNSQRTYLIFSK